MNIIVKSIFTNLTNISDDNFLLELAVKSNSIIVTLNGKDFKSAKLRMKEFINE
jgi:hypothetical protein